MYNAENLIFGSGFDSVKQFQFEDDTKNRVDFWFMVHIGPRRGSSIFAE